MKKTLVMIILVSLVYLNDSDALPCTGAEVCSNYNINCNSVLDGFCPENYGDWSSCDQQTYGKCSPCDPDCGFCGDPNANIQVIANNKADPGENLDIVVVATSSNLQTTSDVMRIIKPNNINDPFTGTERGSSTCPSGLTTCSRTFTQYQVSSVGGDDEFITATTDSFKLQGIKAIKQIEINPEVALSVLNILDANLISPGVSNNIQLNVNIKSLQGVTRTKIYAYKKDPRTNEFRPVKVNGVVDDDPRYCSFQCDPITQLDCNLLKTVEISTLPNDNNFVADWDTTNCDNKEFRLDSIGYDGRDNFNEDSLTLSINNANPPCIDECILFNSRLLNTVYFKVKSWIS